MANLILYELGGLDDRRYSQFSWRTRMALAHKGFAFETVPVRVSDKTAISFSNQDKVPILKDGERVVIDSWKIAEYLEDTYPERASLFGGKTGRGLARFVNAFVDRVLIPKLVPLVMLDVLAIVDAPDGAHLRSGIEKAFRKTLEEMAAQREAGLTDFRGALDPVRATLRAQSFLCGDAPAYADYILFSLFQWARIVSSVDVLAPDDAIVPWRERMLDLFGGLARSQAARSLEAAA
ncbi:MAG: glutathione S-transferase N-terminal domain-containing protein [Pseudorhodoplanes sp.]|nr:glutathione S-transferase N-terminal domain-containing protein [Pseudorhodoplanes sp.]